MPFPAGRLKAGPGSGVPAYRDLYMRSARSVICISEKVRDQVIEGAGPRVNATVIYNGADPEMFSAADGEPGEPLILCVGNLIPIKGHELLLRAFAAIQNQFSGLSLEIIGDGPERSRLQKLADELGIAAKVNFRGTAGPPPGSRRHAARYSFCITQPLRGTGMRVSGGNVGGQTGYRMSRPGD